MCEHERIPCPRCKEVFECKIGTVLLCQCMSVTIDAGEREYIGKQYDTCLCAGCMKILKSEYQNKRFQDRLNRISVLFKPSE